MKNLIIGFLLGVVTCHVFGLLRTTADKVSEDFQQTTVESSAQPLPMAVKAPTTAPQCKCEAVVAPTEKPTEEPTPEESKDDKKDLTPEQRYLEQMWSAEDDPSMKVKKCENALYRSVSQIKNLIDHAYFEPDSQLTKVTLDPSYISELRFLIDNYKNGTY